MHALLGEGHENCVHRFRAPPEPKGSCLAAIAIIDVGFSHSMIAREALIDYIKDGHH